MFRYLSLLVLTLLFGLSVSPGVCQDENVDFSAGSHEKFAETVGNSQEASFKEIFAVYTNHLKANPDDAEAAVERCLFVSYFYASDDYYIEETESMLDESEVYLERFEKIPVVELYLLDQKYGDEMIEKGKALLKDQEIPWSAPELAEIHLELANSYYYQGQENWDEIGKHALISLEKNPTPSAQLMVARFHQAMNEEEKGVEVLLREYPDEIHFQKKQRMNLLSDLGANSEALQLLRELSSEESEIVNSMDSALILAEAGEIDEARAAFDSAKESHWNKVDVAKEYFQFEKDNGTAEDAKTAYTELRNHGFENDPFLYRRFQLFSKYPKLGWEPRDGLGLLALLALFLGVALVPLLILVPVHYWGLLRQRAEKPRVLMAPHWNLRRAWAACALLLLSGIAVSYYFSYDSVFESYFDDYPEEVEVQEDGLAEMVLVSDAILLLGVCLIAGLNRLRETFFPHQWSIGKCLGIAFLWMIPLRIFGGAMNAIFSEPLAMSPLEVSVTIQSLQAVLEQYGPLALFVTIAVITPIVEEVVFRGVLLTSLSSHIPFWAANTIQAALFMVIHETYAAFPFLFAFGIVTGVLRKRSGSLLSCVFLHAINNGLVAVGLIALR